MEKVLILALSLLLSSCVLTTTWDVKSGSEALNGATFSEAIVSNFTGRYIYVNNRVVEPDNTLRVNGYHVQIQIDRLLSDRYSVSPAWNNQTLYLTVM